MTRVNDGFGTIAHGAAAAAAVQVEEGGSRRPQIREGKGKKR